MRKHFVENEDEFMWKLKKLLAFSIASFVECRSLFSNELVSNYLTEKNIYVAITLIEIAVSSILQKIDEMFNSIII